MAEFYRRRLPHLQVIGQPLFITWRLYGSLPGNRVFPETLTSGEAFVAMDTLLDQARSGPVSLKQPEIAELVVGAIEHGEAHLKMYERRAWVVMPNHVHLLITPLVEPARITQTLKRFTAREANKLLGFTGPFWQPESYDRLVRDRTEFEKTARYIQMNPVRAGLAAVPSEYPWSSAAKAD